LRSRSQPHADFASYSFFHEKERLHRKAASVHSEWEALRAPSTRGVFVNNALRSMESRVVAYFNAGLAARIGRPMTLLTGDPRKLKGAAALREIVDRLKTFGADVEKALDGESDQTMSFLGDTPCGNMGVQRGGARRPSWPAPPRRPTRAPNRQADPLVDVHFDGVHLIVTTETGDAGAQVSVEETRLTLRSGVAPERIVTLPCRVKPDSLSVHIVNGVLEATMAPEDPAL
jgi:hypothetical protein